MAGVAKANTSAATTSILTAFFAFMPVPPDNIIFSVFQAWGGTDLRAGGPCSNYKLFLGPNVNLFLGVNILRSAGAGR
jgi:hypothetical protein